MKRVYWIVGTLLALLVLVIAGAIAFGGPKTLPPMNAIVDPFNGVDFSDLPRLQSVVARDGTPLAYRLYPPAPAAVTQSGSVILVHGSSGDGASMHPLAKALAAAGYTAYALDMRGHGGTGEKGKIGYIGQLEDDIADFVAKTSPPAPCTLAGFSSGGGFVLRFAGSKQQDIFQSYLLLSPFLGVDAPTQRPGAGAKWASVGLPRILGLVVLNGIGIHAGNDLPVLRFAIPDRLRAILTPEYSYALLMNFAPQRDYLANIKAVNRPCAIVIGANDEFAKPDQFAPLIHDQGKDFPVTIVPDTDHIHLTLAADAIAADVKAIGALQGRP